MCTELNKYLCHSKVKAPSRNIRINVYRRCFDTLKNTADINSYQLINIIVKFKNPSSKETMNAAIKRRIFLSYYSPSLSTPSSPSRPFFLTLPLPVMPLLTFPCNKIFLLALYFLYQFLIVRYCCM